MTSTPRTLGFALGLAAGLAGGACTTPASYPIFWGDVHGHTSLSDGRGSVADYFAHARGVAQLDFAMVTDHDFGHGPPWWLAAAVIANTEIDADELFFEGRRCELRVEETVRRFLDAGGRTGFVKGSDTHAGRPAARTAVLARELTREGIFEALRQRRCYAVSNARIRLDFQIDGHCMGEEIALDSAPRIRVRVQGTAAIREVAIVHDGATLLAVSPMTAQFELEHGNPSRAWSSPIFVRRRSGARGLDGARAPDSESPRAR